MFKINYYHFNRKELLQKAKENYSNEAIRNKQKSNKKNPKNQYINLSEEEKDKIKKYQRKRYQQLIQ